MLSAEPFKSGIHLLAPQGMRGCLRCMDALLLSAWHFVFVLRSHHPAVVARHPVLHAFTRQLGAKTIPRRREADEGGKDVLSGLVWFGLVWSFVRVCGRCARESGRPFVFHSFVRSFVCSFVRLSAVSRSEFELESE